MKLEFLCDAFMKRPRDPEVLVFCCFCAAGAFCENKNLRAPPETMAQSSILCRWRGSNQEDESSALAGYAAAVVFPPVFRAGKFAVLVTHPSFAPARPQLSGFHRKDL